VSTQLAIIDSGGANIASLLFAMERLGVAAVLTTDPAQLHAASHVMLPGVGAAADCMARLRKAGLIETIRQLRQPLLGICIGMQLLFEGSDESPGVEGLGVLPGRLRLLPDGVKRPQMQWNLLERRGDPELLRQAPDPAWAYFVHSYAADTDDAIVTATCDYGGRVVAAVEQGSVWATQFHPEKSSRTGLAVLSAFVDRCAAQVPAG